MRKLHWSLLKRLYRLRSRYGVYSRLDRYWLLDNQNWIDQQLIIRRPYEVGQIERCRQFVSDHQLNYFFDVGANFGLYSVLLSGESDLEELHAFEPLPRNAHQFSANLFLNSLGRRVKLHNIALSDNSGQLDLYVDPGSTGVSTLLPADTGSRKDAYKTTVRVETEIFDQLFSFSGIRALVKIDVEGAELMTLAGMRKFLGDNRVVIQIETTQQTHEPVEAFMLEVGYHALGRLGADAWYGNI